MGNDEPNYGALNNVTLWDKIRILQEWAPVATYVQAFLAERDPHRKTLIVADACEWLASKSKNTKVDDELVDHVTAILKSPQGESFLRWIADKIDGSEAK
jgi:hypothetical protein